MKREVYEQKRAELLAAAKTMFDSGDYEGAKAKGAEVEALDGQYEDAAKLQANLDTLSGKPLPANPLAQSDVTAAGAASMVSEETVFAKAMLDLPLSTEESAVYARLSHTSAQANANTAANNPLVIPKTMEERIWEEMEALHPVITDVMPTHIKGNMSILKSKDQADAEWYDEDTPTDDSELGFATVDLNGCELSKAVPVSYKMEKMSVSDFIPYIIRMIARRMGAALANGYISGKGKPGTSDTFKAQPTGVVTKLRTEADTPQITTYDPTAGVKFSDITKLISKINGGYVQGGCFYAQNDFIWNGLANITDDSGKPLFIPDPTGAGIGKLFGITVKAEEAIPADSLMFGNFGYGYASNINEDMTMYYDDHPKQRIKEYVGYMLVDGAPITTEAFALMEKNA